MSSTQASTEDTLASRFDKLGGKEASVSLVPLVQHPSSPRHHGEVRLNQLLVEAFPNGDLRRLLWRLYGDRVIKALPDVSVPEDEFAFSAVMRLKEEGLVDRRLLLALMGERPGRRTEILQIGELLGIVFPAAEELGRSDLRDVQFLFICESLSESQLMAVIQAIQKVTGKDRLELWGLIKGSYRLLLRLTPEVVEALRSAELVRQLSAITGASVEVAKSWEVVEGGRPAREDLLAHSLAHMDFREMQADDLMASAERLIRMYVADSRREEALSKTGARRTQTCIVTVDLEGVEFDSFCRALEERLMGSLDGPFEAVAEGPGGDFALPSAAVSRLEAEGLQYHSAMMLRFEGAVGEDIWTVVVASASSKSAAMAMRSP